MDYELSKRLIDIAESGKKTNRRFNLASFLSLQSQINTAIEDGWSIKFIWEALYEDKKINFGYRTFLRMVKERSSNYSPARRKKTNNDKEESLDSLPKSKKETESNNDTNHDKHSGVEKSDKNLKTDSSQKSISVTEDSKDRDRGSPKGFVWDPIPNPDDLF